MASAEEPSSPAPTNVFLMGNKAPKADEAGCGDESVGYREKKKRRNRRDAEIALYKLKSAEALAGMKQVKTMINRFELAQFSEAEDVLPHKRKSRPEQQHAKILHSISKASSKDELQKKGKEQQKNLNHVWESVLKPVRQRVIEIEKVLADTNPPPKLSHEDVARHLRGTSSKCSSSTDDDNQALRTQVEEGEMKIRSLQESLKQANERADRVKAENQRVADELKRMLLYQSAFSEEQKKNMRLEDQLKQTQSDVLGMEQEFVQKLKSVQDKLYEEELKNKQLLEDLRASSIKIEHEKDMTELIQKIQFYHHQNHEEHLKNVQLEEQLHQTQVASTDQIKSMKKCYDRKLQTAEENLSAEQKKCNELKIAWQKQRDQYILERKQLECKLTQQIAELKAKLDQATVHGNKLSNLLQANQEKHEKELIAIQEKLTKSFQERLDSEKAEVVMECSGKQEECNHKIESYTQEINSLKVQLQKALGKEMDHHQQVFSLKSTNDEVQHAYKTLVSRARKLEEDLKQKTELLSEEEKRRSALMKELEEYRNAGKTRMVDDIKFQNLQERHRDVQKQIETLRTERNALKVQLCTLQEEIKVERQKFEDEFGRKIRENEKLTGKLHRASAVIKTCKYSMKQLIHSKDDMQLRFLEQQHKTQELREKNLAATAQIQKMEKELRDQIHGYEEKIAKEHLRNSTLQERFSQLEDQARRAHKSEEEFKQQMKKLKEELKQAKNENVKQQEQLRGAQETIRTSNEQQRELKQKVEMLQLSLQTEQETLIKLQDRLQRNETAAIHGDLVELSYNQKLVTLQEELRREQEKNTALQFEKHKAFDQMKTMEKDMAEKVQLHQEEETKRTKLQTEMSQQSEHSQKTHDQLAQQLESYKAELLRLKEQNEALLTDKEKTLKHVSLIEERLQDKTALLKIEKEKSDSSQTKLIKLKESVRMDKYSQQEYEQKLDHLEEELREEKDVNEILQTERDHLSEQLKHTKTELYEKNQALSEEKQKNGTLHERMHQMEKTALQMGDVQNEYEVQLANIQRSLQKEEEKANELRLERDAAYEKINTMDEKMKTMEEEIKCMDDEMKGMDNNLHDRLEAFKEVFHEEQQRITSLQEELEQCKITTEAKIKELKEENEKLVKENDSLIEENDKLIEENEKLIEENENLISENDKLISDNNRLLSENEQLSDRDTMATATETEAVETEDPDAGDWSRHRRSSEHSLGTNSSSQEFVVDSSDMQDFSDEELGNNVNNNRVQSHLSRLVNSLHHRLQQQDRCISDYGDSIGDYVSHLEHRNKLCAAYIAELEAVREVSREEIARLVMLVQQFARGAVGADEAKLVQCVLANERLEQLLINHQHGEQPQEQQARIIELPLPTYSNSESQDEKPDQDNNQFEHLVNQYESQDSELEPQSSEPEPQSSEPESQSTEVEPRRSELQRSELEPQRSEVELQSSALDPLDQAGTGEKTESQEHESRYNDPLRTLLDSLHAKLQKTADQWQELEELFRNGEDEEGEGCDTQQAIGSLFHIFQQLLEMIVVITTANEHLNAEMSRWMRCGHGHGKGLRDGSDVTLRDLQLRLRVAEQRNEAYNNEVAEMSATIQGLEAALSGKISHDGSESSLILKQGRRGIPVHQKQALDIVAARVQKQHQAALKDLQFQLDLTSKQLEERTRSLDLATNALNDLKQDFESERSQKQRQGCKQRAELAARDAHAQHLTSQITHLQTVIADMKKAEKTPPKRSTAADDTTTTKSCTEVGLLRKRLKQSETKIKAAQTDSNVQVKKLRVKLEKAHGLLRRMPNEHERCLRVCQEKLNALCHELAVQKNSRVVDRKKIVELSYVSCAILHQVQTMQRRMVKLKESIN